MLTYRKTTKNEDENYNIRCTVTKPNTMQCERRVTRMANLKFYCEGHFQVLLQTAQQIKDTILDLDAPREELTSESEPTEKPKEVV
jgi:hypothetical protein